MPEAPDAVNRPTPSSPPQPPSRVAHAAAQHRETVYEQLSGFVGFFVWLLVLKSFFLPLFIIPTGSMAHTLYGEHATHTCVNCGFEFPVGFDRADDPAWGPGEVAWCQNCSFMQVNRARPPSRLSGEIDAVNRDAPAQLRGVAGDRIVVHGWMYDLPFSLGGLLAPRRWDVVVFRNPTSPQENFIKRLIGLPGEKIEVIDGDIFINDRIERKSRAAQRALWFPYYNDDYRPARPGNRDRRDLSRPTYLPRWVARGWQGGGSRAYRFDGAASDTPGVLQFATVPGQDDQPGEIRDFYSYNGLRPQHVLNNTVSDVRLSCSVTLAEGSGYVELSTTKYDDAFYARIYADGRVTLERARAGDQDAPREKWGEARVALHPETRIALAVADYRAAVEIDGREVCESSDTQFGIDVSTARERSVHPKNPILRISAAQVRATVAHLLIERDVFYTGDGRFPDGTPGNGVTGNPFNIGPDAYFVMGDNSPNSHDARFWRTAGPHLDQAVAEGRYRYGTVPADQMIGRAFLVYLPGLEPLTARGPNLLPDVGRVRWIR